MVERVGIGPEAGVSDRAVGGLDGEHADVVGRGCSFDFGTDGFDGIDFHSCVLLLVLVTEYLARFDRFVEFIGIDERLALDLEELDLALLDEAVEGCRADL